LGVGRILKHFLGRPRGVRTEKGFSACSCNRTLAPTLTESIDKPGPGPMCFNPLLMTVPRVLEWKGMTVVLRWFPTEADWANHVPIALGKVRRTIFGRDKCTRLVDRLELLQIVVASGRTGTNATRTAVHLQPTDTLHIDTIQVAACRIPLEAPPLTSTVGIEALPGTQGTCRITVCKITNCSTGWWHRKAGIHQTPITHHPSCYNLAAPL